MSTVRSQFLLPKPIAEKLRKASFEKRTTKTKIVIEALEEKLK